MFTYILGIYVLLQLIAATTGVVALLVYVLDNGSWIYAIKDLYDKSIKEYIVLNCTFPGYAIGIILLFVVMEIILFPYTLDIYLKNRRKNKKNAPAVSKQDKKYPVFDLCYEYNINTYYFTYGKRKINVDCIIFDVKEQLKDLSEKVNYIRDNNIIIYKQMKYTLDLIFNNLEYTLSECPDNFNKALKESCKIIEKIYLKVKEDTLNNLQELENKKKKIINNYQNETKKTFKSLNEYWDKILE